MSSLFKQSPLVNHYAGKYLDQLLSNPPKGKIERPFVELADYPQRLEERLQRIEPLGITQEIFDEMGDSIEDSAILNMQLWNKWAEIRAVYQLFVEGFTHLKKVVERADFTAICGKQNFAFQVVNVNTSLKSEVERIRSRDPKTPYKNDPYGSLAEIYDNDRQDGKQPRGLARADSPISYVFWDRLKYKNKNFEPWLYGGIRCIVVITRDEDLQDNLTRHIACQKLRESIHHDDLGKLNFEQLLWLPDTGNGAWFVVGATLQETHCFVDWKDEIPDPDGEPIPAVNRRELDLDSYIPTLKNINWKAC